LSYCYCCCWLLLAVAGCYCCCFWYCCWYCCCVNRINLTLVDLIWFKMLLAVLALCVFCRSTRRPGGCCFSTYFETTYCCSAFVASLLSWGSASRKFFSLFARNLSIEHTSKMLKFFFHMCSQWFFRISFIFIGHWQNNK
jgi:hypothetical protein